MTRRALFITALLGFVHIAPRIACAQSARAWADSTSFVVGDPITVHVEIQLPENAALHPLGGDTLGAFSVLSRAPFEKPSAVQFVSSVTVAAYDSGAAVLPPMGFAYSVPTDSAPKTVETNPLTFSIRLADVDTSKGIKDIKPVLDIPFTVAEWSLIAGSIVGLGWLAYSIVQYRKRKRLLARKEEEYVPPPKAAHILALEELASLKEKRLWQQGLVKPYYSEATEILRRYFEHRFGFMALEKTTDEIIDDLRNFSGAHAVLEQTDRILRRADLVKFAKHQASIPEHEETLAAAFEIVDRTRIVDLAPQKTNEMESANA